MRGLGVTFLLGLSLLFAAAGRRAAAAEEGVGLGGVRRVRVTGTVFDAQTGRPLPEAQVALVGPSGNRYGTAGPDGSFLVAATSEEGLGDVSIIFSHSEYQQKYLDTVLRDAFRGRVEVRVEAGRAHLKAKGLNLDLGCGRGAEVATPSPETAPFRVVCENGLTGVEFEVRRNRIAVLAAGPFTLRVGDGRLEVRDARSDAVEIRVAAAMLPR